VPDLAKKLVLHSKYNDTLRGINSINPTIPPGANAVNISLGSPDGRHSAGSVSVLEEFDKVALSGDQWRKSPLAKRSVAAYDESIIKYDCLEGASFFTAHSVVLLSETEYLPSLLLSLYFYTKAQAIADKCAYIKFALDPELESKRDYMLDKLAFLEENVPAGTLLLIDGPLIAGDVYTYMMRTLERFRKKDIIPVFFVKNSSSNLVTDNFPGLSGKYNSDMHWAYSLLKPGERTRFFKYVDPHNDVNQKAFCYLKALDVSPQRVEIHSPTFDLHADDISSLMSLIYYFIIAQGSTTNPQLRPIAIAEVYAREALRLADFRGLAGQMRVIPTMNQVRFGW
jgi:hypothetical protein